jgi:hypothetical protein
MTRNGLTEEEENEDSKKFMETTQKRLIHMQNNQNEAMPKVCQGMPYTGPKIVTHKTEKNGNNCVITNDTHSKMTNNGF